MTQQELIRTIPREVRISVTGDPQPKGSGFLVQRRSLLLKKGTHEAIQAPDSTPP